jgi:hypothetical protein
MKINVKRHKRKTKHGWTWVRGYSKTIKRKRKYGMAPVWQIAIDAPTKHGKFKSTEEGTSKTIEKEFRPEKSKLVEIFATVDQPGKKPHFSIIRQVQEQGRDTIKSSRALNIQELRKQAKGKKKLTGREINKFIEQQVQKGGIDGVYLHEYGKGQQLFEESIKDVDLAKKTKTQVKTIKPDDMINIETGEITEGQPKLSPAAQKALKLMGQKREEERRKNKEAVRANDELRKEIYGKP